MNKKLVRKIISLIFAIFGLFLSYVFVFLMPIRFAIKPENTDTSKFYVIAEPISATEYEWSIVKEKDNSEEVAIDTKINGNLPNVAYEYSFINENNQFVLYGHYEEKTYANNQWSAVFYVDEFDVLYPVKHGITGTGILDNVHSWYISYLDIASDFNFEELKKFFVN